MPTASSGGEDAPLTLVDCIKDLRSLHERRARAHAKFNAGLRSSVESLKDGEGDSSGYEQMVKEVTDELVEINGHLVELAEALENIPGQQEVARILEAMQELEDECVTTTASIHVLKRSFAAGLRAPLDDESSGQLDSEGKLRDLTKTIERVDAEMNDLVAELVELQLDLDPE